MSFSGKPYGISPITGLMQPLTNISGLSNLYFVRVATTANLSATYDSGAKTLTNSGANVTLSVDGVALSATNIILVKNQSTASQNGLYIVTVAGDGATAWVLTRSTDMDTTVEAEERDFFWATEGTANAGNGYTLTTSGTISLDTTSLTFSRTLGSATGSGQAASDALTDVSDVGVVSAADKFHYSTAQGVWAEAAVTAAARALLDDTTAEAMRTTLGVGGGASPGPYDWADPYYEQVGDSLSSVLLADWPDASTVGGASSIYRVQIQERAIRLKPTFAADGTTDYGTTNRAGGILRSIGAGDFRVAMRYTVATVSLTTAPYVVVVGPAFVDGASAEANSWYGWTMYMAGNYVNGATLYRMNNEAGGARWETYSGYDSLYSTPGWTNIDAVIERVGTTLTCYMGAARGALTSLGSHTVTTGGGLIGLRHQTLLGGSAVVDTTLLAYRTGLTEVP